MNKISLNKSDYKELLKVRHLGVVRVHHILKTREEQPFKDIYELSTIPGLGKKRVDDIIEQGLLTV